MKQQVDVIVIGGGHAGCEAAAAAARIGARVALITFDVANIGAMSCNPAIGGIGKGHLVREVDACGGIIAAAADRAAIHYRMLNRSKGAAVWGPRVQADRALFATAVQDAIAALPGITIVPGEAVALAIRNAGVTGVALADGTALTAPNVVLATGTFLSARLFRGEWRADGGRVQERAAAALGVQLRELGLPMGRMKTGTPPRIDGRTIDWAQLAEQRSDPDPWVFSLRTKRRSQPQLFCAITRTNAVTHDLIRDAMHRSPLLSPDMTAGGPRYCPSIEDKIARFGDRDGHQIFLEPEELRTHLIYPNGISTSLPADVQQAVVRSLPGLTRAEVVEPGYAVEYDHVDPRVLGMDLQVRDIAGLFLAGQINGTTGYEEAAAQGLAAGAAAGARAMDREAMRFDRASSYIGVMIDDLSLQGVTEPYRMLTSRAEHRLHLRADNAEARLGHDADRHGLLDAAASQALDRRAAARDHARSAIATGHAPSAAYLAFDDFIATRPDLWELPNDIVSEVFHDVRYAPYVKRNSVMALHEDEAAVPMNFDFGSIPGLSVEMRGRLDSARPSTLAQAGRVRGITPAALTALAVALHRR